MMELYMNPSFLLGCQFLFFFIQKMVKSCLFSVGVNLARRNPIALVAVVLASINKDLTYLRKKIIDLSKYLVGDDIFPV
jgi:hypothetical protein